MPYPAKLGQPCWDAHQVEKVLSILAQTNEQSADAFLAAHSPFRFISNLRDPGGGELTEEDVFQAIFGRRGEVQAAIKGEPGTGKSHLVHWLKLRADYEAEQGDDRARKLVRVLVQRGNGSLKNALRQIVERLGPTFAEHLRRVQGAIDKVSDETARATFLSELALEIDPRWGRERTDRPAFKKKLRMLAPSLQSQGVRRWLLRKGGVIDQTVRRLTQGVAPSEHDQWPVFTLEELTPDAQYLSLAENAENVRLFFEDLGEERNLRQDAVEALNLVRQDALASLTGLGRSDLREIFDDLRGELHKQKRELALFIEDVSVTGLDREIINALEPQPRDGLCRMVAVIGVTSNAWIPLEENQKGRFDPVFEVGAAVTARWSANPQEVASFTGRYLNAIRSTDQEIAEMARKRREGGGRVDVPMSKCDDCPVRPECHAAFETVSLPGEVTIGLFPFTPRAPQALLAGLNEDTERTGVRRSQRGLIENVLIPVLQNSRDALEQGNFPRPASLPVRIARPAAWTEFTHTYLGGTNSLDATTRDRYQLLGEYWAGGANEDELAVNLGPILKPLGLPELRRTACGTRTKVTKAEVTGEQEPRPPTEKEEALPPAFRARLQVLEDWSRGQPLSGDGEIRQSVADLLSRAISWADQREIQPAVARDVVGSRNFVRIEGQVSAPVHNTVTFTLPRNEETRGLLEALLRFALLGGRTWNFKNGELHKREVWRWLRKHRATVAATLVPDAKVSRTDAVAAAARALALTAVLRERKPVRKGDDDALARLLTPVWPEEQKPAALADPMKELIADLALRHQRLRDFVLAELGAGQGDAAPKDFLDPRALLEALPKDGELPVPLPLGPEYHQGHWEKRFIALKGLAQFADLRQRLEAERARAAEIVADLKTLLEECGANLGVDLRASFEAWLAELAEMIAIQRGSGPIRKLKLDLPHPAFDELWMEQVIQRQEARSKLARTFGEADALAHEADSLERWLTFEARELRRLSDTLRICQRHLEKLDRELREQEEHLTATGGGDQDALLAELAALALTVAPESASTPAHESE